MLRPNNFFSIKKAIARKTTFALVLFPFLSCSKVGNKDATDGVEPIIKNEKLELDRDKFLAVKEKTTEEINIKQEIARLNKEKAATAKNKTEEELRLKREKKELDQEKLAFAKTKQEEELKLKQKKIELDAKKAQATENKIEADIQLKQDKLNHEREKLEHNRLKETNRVFLKNRELDIKEGKKTKAKDDKAPPEIIEDPEENDDNQNEELQPKEEITKELENDFEKGDQATIPFSPEIVAASKDAEKNRAIYNEIVTLCDAGNNCQAFKIALVKLIKKIDYKFCEDQELLEKTINRLFIRIPKTKSTSTTEYKNILQKLVEKIRANNPDYYAKHKNTLNIVFV